MFSRQVKVVLRHLAVILVTVLVVSAPAVAQDVGDEGPNADQTIGQLLFNVRHYIAIGSWSLAADYIDAILAQDPPAEELLAPLRDDKILSDTNSGLEAMLRKVVDRSPQTPEEQRLRNGAIKLQQLIDKRRGPGATLEEIEKQIASLTVSERGFDRAVENLRRMAPNSVPVMLNHVRRNEDKELSAQIIRALPMMGRKAVEPLIAYLDAPGEVPDKVLVIRILQDIGYPQAIPYIQAQGEKSDSTQLKEAVDRAVTRLGRTPRAEFSGSAANMFTQLGDMFYSDAPSLRSPVAGESVPVWMFDSQLNTAKSVSVPVAVYNERMAMRSLERGLLLDADQREAQALWIAANIRREAQLEGADDPMDGANEPGAHYYAVAHGPSYLLMALDRAIKDGDAQVAFGVARALADVGSVAAVGDEVAVLSNAVMFPDRKVRWEIGMWMADAACKSGTKLPAAEFVVPTLAQAVSTTGAKYAIVMLPDGEARQKLEDQVRQAGYTVYSVATRQEVLEKARSLEVPYVGLLVIGYDQADGGLAGIAELRKDYRLAYAPTLAVTNGIERAKLALRDVPYTTAVLPTVLADEITTTAAALMGEAAQLPMTDAEADAFALRAAVALRDVALTNPPGMDFSVAVAALVHSLTDPRIELAKAVAVALSFSENPAAQSSLAGAALDAGNDAPRRIAMFDALADSARRNGNKLNDSQAVAVRKAARTEADLAVRTSAAKALGALNLPASQTGELITSQSKLK